MTDSKEEGKPVAVVNHEFLQLTAELEVAIVDTMVQDFLAGKLTHERAIGHVAAIAQMRKMQNILDGRVRKDLARARKEAI